MFYQLFHTKSTFLQLYNLLMCILLKYDLLYFYYTITKPVLIFCRPCDHFQAGCSQISQKIKKQIIKTQRFVLLLCYSAQTTIEGWWNQSTTFLENKTLFLFNSSYLWVIVVDFFKIIWSLSDYITIKK